VDVFLISLKRITCELHRKTITTIFKQSTIYVHGKCFCVCLFLKLGRGEGERVRGVFFMLSFFCFLFLFVYIFNNRILYLKSEVNLHNSHIDIVSETKFHGLIFYSKLHSLPELFFLVFTSTCHSFLSCIKWKTIH
jgi:uncharacterized membrane protein